MADSGPNRSWMSSLQTIRERIWVYAYDPDDGLMNSLRSWWYGPLTDRMYRYTMEHAQKDDPASVLEAIDLFSRERQFTFCLGDDKGPIVKKIVEDTKPMTCLELGTFVGYSAINAARVLPEGARYTCIEPDKERVKTARKLVEFAGLQDTIRIIQGFSSDVIPTLKGELGIDAFDYIFIDHVKSMYKSDLLLLEDQTLLKPGTVIVADNIIFPGAPGYAEYVRNSPKYTSEFFESVLEYTHMMDGVEKSTFIG